MGGGEIKKHSARDPRTIEEKQLRGSWAAFPRRVTSDLPSLCQPDDQGTINGIPVLRVTRQGPDALHFVQTPLEPGTEVELLLDWDRRFDHMQQHSGEKAEKEMARRTGKGGSKSRSTDKPFLTGQHLITAVADQMFGFKTTSW